MNHAPALLVACVLTLLAGCGSEAVYTEESFGADSPFTLKLKEPAPVACESARRSLLGQGYLIDTAAGEQVKGRKAYRRDSSQNTFIEMNVVCVADRKGSTLYANGVLSTYDLKKSGNSASVGISAVGSISLPIGQSADSLVKIAEETIEDKAFYGRFFAAVNHVLKEMEARPEEDETPSSQGPAPAKPAPEADIPLEQGPASTPGIVPEPGPAPLSPAAGQPQPVIVPEPGAPSPATGSAATVSPTNTGAASNPAAPGPVQGFSVATPAAAAPASAPAAMPATTAAPAAAPSAVPESGAPPTLNPTPAASPTAPAATANPEATPAPSSQLTTQPVAPGAGSTPNSQPGASPHT